jgi:hypothetical protein
VHPCSKTLLLLLLLFVITLTQGIYNHTPETKDAARAHNFAAILYLKFMLRVMLFLTFIIIIIANFIIAIISIIAVVALSHVVCFFITAGFVTGH